MITGDKDPFYDKTIETVDILRANGVPCKLIVNKGMGHSLPDEFTNHLKKLLTLF